MRSSLTVRTTAPVLALGIALLTLTACTSSNDAPKVAGGSDKSPQEAPKDADTIRQKWLTCMHDAGHANLKLDASGRMKVQGLKPGGGLVDENFEADMKSCDSKVPGMQQLQEKPAAASDLKKARGLASCLRQNGITGIKDPDPKTGALILPKDLDFKVWNKASGICSKKFPGVPVLSQAVGAGGSGE